MLTSYSSSAVDDDVEVDVVSTSQPVDIQSWRQSYAVSDSGYSTLSPSPYSSRLTASDQEEIVNPLTQLAIIATGPHSPLLNNNQALTDYQRYHCNFVLVAYICVCVCVWCVSVCGAFVCGVCVSLCGACLWVCLQSACRCLCVVRLCGCVSLWAGKVLTGLSQPSNFAALLGNCKIDKVKPDSLMSILVDFIRQFYNFPKVQQK